MTTSINLGLKNFKEYISFKINCVQHLLTKKTNKTAIHTFKKISKQPKEKILFLINAYHKAVQFTKERNFPKKFKNKQLIRDQILKKTASDIILQLNQTNEHTSFKDYEDKLNYIQDQTYGNKLSSEITKAKGFFSYPGIKHHDILAYLKTKKPGTFWITRGELSGEQIHQPTCFFLYYKTPLSKEKSLNSIPIQPAKNGIEISNRNFETLEDALNNLKLNKPVSREALLEAIELIKKQIKCSPYFDKKSQDISSAMLNLQYNTTRNYALFLNEESKYFLLYKKNKKVHKQSFRPTINGVHWFPHSDGTLEEFITKTLTSKKVCQNLLEHKPDTPRPKS